MMSRKQSPTTVQALKLVREGCTIADAARAVGAPYVTIRAAVKSEPERVERNEWKDRLRAQKSGKNIPPPMYLIDEYTSKHLPVHRILIDEHEKTIDT